MADSKITDLTNYSPAVDVDVLPIVDVTTDTTKKITWANIKATLKTYNDTLYPATSTVVKLDQTSGQTIGDTTNRLTKLWATDITVTNAITGSITGNAGTVTNGIYTTSDATSLAANAANKDKYLHTNASTGVLEWTTVSGVGGASTALDNLASVAINTALIPNTAGALDFGSTTKPWAALWFAGTSSTPGTNQFKITGASTSGVRTITAPDRSITLDNVTTSTTTNGTGFLKGNGSVISFDNSTYLTSIGTGVTNQITYWSGTNAIGALDTATYPSLTELSYVKGVTSAIQTQLNAKGVGDMTLAGIQSVTGAKTFDKDKILMKGTSTGVTTFSTANASSTSYTITFPATTGTVALTSDLSSFITSGGALGTPSSGTLTNCGSLPISGLTASTSTAIGVGSIELGHATDTTISRSSAGIIAVEGVTVPLNSITNTHTAQQIELGHATDTTIARVSAGVVSIEGNNIITANKQVTDLAAASAGDKDKYLHANASTGAIEWTTVSASGGSFWTLMPGTPTRASNTTFTITGDYSSLIAKGMIIKWTESSTVRVAMVSIPSTYSNPNTTVTIIGDTMASIDASSLKYAMIGAEPFTARFAIAGTIGATGTDIANAYYATEPMRVIGADLQVGTAGTTNSTTIDINKGGTTMFTTKPTLGSTVATTATPQSADTATSLALADKVTIDIDAVQTTAAIDLYAQLYLFPTRYCNLT